METRVSGQLQYLTADNIPVPHAFTTRLGGVSKFSLSSLNLGIHRGDDPKNVLKNYEIQCSALGFSPTQLVLSTQVHSDIILRVGLAEQGAGLFAPELPNCDALITNTPGVGLMVFTADCTPVLLWDSKQGAVAAIHAGWKGTAQDIVGKTVLAMAREFGSHPEDLHAAIGPNIGGCCFETDAEVPEALLAVYGQKIAGYIRKTGEKYFPDLKAVNTYALRRLGVQNIDLSTDCTMCNPRRYWSHRVTRGDRGSQGAMILCQGDAL